MFSSRPSMHSVPAYAGPVPASLHAGPVPVGSIPTTLGTRKRKASDAADGDDLRRTHAPALPALDGTFNPLEHQHNHAFLSALHMLPGQSNASALQMHLATPSSDTDMSGGSDAGGGGRAPSLAQQDRDGSSPASSLYELPATPTGTGSVDLYPGVSRGMANGADRDGSTFCGLLGPAQGAVAAVADHAMQMDDDHFQPQPAHNEARHGPHCQDIPQLSVRHDPFTGSAELWATCPSCGAYTRVQEESDALPYSQYAS